MLVLAASAFVVLAAEPVYLLVDTVVVGHLGQRALAGLGVGAALLGLLTIIGTFVEYGTTGRAARWYGAGRYDDAVREGVQATWLALGIGVVVVVVGEIFAAPLTGLLAGSDATQAAAESWFRIAVLGLPGVLVVMAGNGWMRGVQRTRQPVVIVVVANALSAVASPLLVYPADMGLRGSAIALLLDSFAIAAQSLVGAALGGTDAAGARLVAADIARWGLGAGVAFALLYAAGWSLIPRAFSPSADVQHQAHILWPWFVAMLPVAGIVFALDGVLIGAGDVGFLRTITVVSAVFAFAPLNLAALHWHWGLGGIWAGLTAFVVVRFAGMVWRVRGDRWLVTGTLPKTR